MKENKIDDSIPENKNAPTSSHNQTNIGKQTDESEDLEVDILRLFKLKSRRVNNKVIIIIIVVLLFLGWMLKM